MTTKRWIIFLSSAIALLMGGKIMAQVPNMIHYPFPQHVDYAPNTIVPTIAVKANKMMMFGLSMNTGKLNI